ncbi:hypothetical protein DFH08DRAFT_825272 [Mycena albidolilacea]|uniref:Uncharacterized protein n=1 Tax=Mycena albidolilacea TaxID=1033008 RepID=A0AAD6YZE3_9AGAR|nr:hypothetical protein DFH08DRAFT_828516 [Mycena albidolilacea]KAJ7302172.1 hypothetical protein DFH08DRAFT_826924 [Mycena albidolilacea]KAJ7304914.1 hypothetical protein DFH08DRAFT_825272 [Mycena albidolilacea]
MPNQTAETPPTTLKQSAPRKPSKAVSRTAATMTARRQAQARYRQKNLEEEREKARERMARYRERISQQEDSRVAFLERARQASHKHRAKCALLVAHSALTLIRVYYRNSEALAHRQRIIRLEVFDKKHNRPHAWLKRQNLLEERRAEAQAERRVDEPQIPQEELTGWWPRI